MDCDTGGEIREQSSNSSHADYILKKLYIAPADHLLC